MKKTVLISVISLLFLCTSVAQVRNYVGSIQLNHNPETVSMLEIWQAGLKADGYEDLSEQVENYLKTGAAPVLLMWIRKEKIILSRVHTEFRLLRPVLFDLKKSTEIL